MPTYKKYPSLLLLVEFVIHRVHLPVGSSDSGKHCAIVRLGNTHTGAQKQNS